MSDLLFRGGTWDRAIWDGVADNREYRLGVRFDPADAVIDVGGHIGAFTYLALDRGAGRVVTVEPDPANLAMLIHNIAVACRAGNRFVPVGAALGPDQPRSLRFMRSTNPHNTGGGGVGNPEGEFEVATVRLDALLDLAGPGDVRLVKLDCEGGEWPALEHIDRVAHRVRAWVGEYHLGSALADGRDAGWLADRFEKEGYKHVFERKSDTMGLFWAWRTGSEIL